MFFQKFHINPECSNNFCYPFCTLLPRTTKAFPWASFQLYNLSETYWTGEFTRSMLNISASSKVLFSIYFTFKLSIDIEHPLAVANFDSGYRNLKMTSNRPPIYRLRGI